MNGTAKWLGRNALLNLGIAALITLSFVDWRAHLSWRYAVEQFAISLLIASCISPLCVILLPRITRRVFARFSLPLNWILLLAVMFAIAAGGSLFALAILAAVGYLRPDQILEAWFNSALKVSVIATLSFGIFFTSRGILRNRLKSATLALRTKERDEAEARRVATEAQLASLESRVQPHFLFNTLNSIAALIPQDPAGAERMTGQLASLLRASLDNAGSPLVPLEQELKTVTDYLEIERVRFGDRLRYDIHIEPGLDQFPVPRMSLQTLVENSVKYAVSPSRDGATMHIRANRSNGTTHLVVEDDGPGFGEDGEPAGHGLALLRDRLKITYGDAATLATHRVDGWTQAHIAITKAEIRN